MILTFTELKNLSRGKIEEKVNVAEITIKQYREGLLTADELSNQLIGCGMEIQSAVFQVGGMALSL